MEIAGRVWLGVAAGTPLTVKPVGFDATAPGVAWYPNDVVWPLAIWPFQASLRIT